MQPHMFLAASRDPPLLLLLLLLLLAVCLLVFASCISSTRSHMLTCQLSVQEQEAPAFVPSLCLSPIVLLEYELSNCSSDPISHQPAL